MSERRCPNCGGLVGADAEWCTQCFARLDEAPSAPATLPGPQAEQPEGPSVSSAPAPAPRPTPSVSVATEGGGAVRSKGDEIVWDCPQCGTENPLDSRSCSVCGTAFGAMFQEPEEQNVSVDPGRAAMFSLFFPGAGHWLIGRKGEAFARGVIFLFALIMGLFSLGAVSSGNRGLYLLLMVVSLAAAAAIYIISVADAGRSARGDPPILSMRVLLYGGVGLIFLDMLLLTLAATRARS